MRLTAFPRDRYDRPTAGGAIIPEDNGSDYDFERLESAVAALLASHEQLRVENAEFHSVLRDKERHIKRLDEKLLAANQRRQDVGKHIDDLIAQIDQLDSQFESQEEL